jgi:hypothetical protein
LIRTIAGLTGVFLLSIGRGKFEVDNDEHDASDLPK